MKTGYSVLVIVCSVCAVSCGSPSSPTNVLALSTKDLKGSWGSSWRWSEVAIYSQGLTGGPSTQIKECTATIDITSQSASGFEGRYTIDCAASRYTGMVADGHLNVSSNQLSFTIVSETGGDPAMAAGWSYPSCQIADPHRYEGMLNGDSLDVSRYLTIDCPPGRLLVSSTFHGTRRQ